MKAFSIIAFFFIYNYCNAQNNYCIPSPPSGVNGYSITKITLESLDTTFSGNVYQFIRDSVHHETCYLEPGTNYRIYLTSGTHTTSSLAAWIDWNNDTTFSSSEKLGEVVTSSSGQNVSISFTVPPGCFKGKLRLRVRASNSSSINACNNYTSGQTIDFVITTLNPVYQNNFYPSWEFSNTGNFYIDGVSIGSINNINSGGINGPVYGDYSYLTTDLDACKNYYISITGNFSTDPNEIFIYIDYNNNGIFETIELLPTIIFPAGNHTDSILFVPNAVTTQCRMRIIYYANQEIIEVEDYSLNIQNSSATFFPTANIGSDMYYECDTACFFYGCTGTNTFHDYSCGVPSTRLWTISGVSPSTSTSKNPTFNFPSPGLYNVLLEVSNSFGTDAMTAQVYIKSPVANINLGSNTTLCTGDSIQLSAPSGSCYSYHWSTGATSRQIYASTSGSYLVEVTTCNYYDCPAYDTISINFTPNVYSITGGGNYCIGGTGSAIGLNDSQSGVSYQLLRNGIPAGVPVSGTGNAISFGLQTQSGTYTVSATSSTPVCSRTMTGSVAVGIVALPSAYSVFGGGSFCAGSSGLSIGLADSENGVHYQLFRNGTAIGTTINGTGDTIQFPNHSQSGNYTVVGTANNSSCSTSMTDTANLNSIPSPQVFNVSGGGTFCGGTLNSKVVLSDSHIGATYELFRNGIATGITHMGNDSALSFTHLLQSGTYTVKATDSSTCVSNMSGSASLTIIDTPFPFDLTGGGNFCNGSSLDSILLNGSEDWVRYQLYLDSFPVGNSLNGDGDTLNFGLQTTEGNYFVVGSNTITGCYLPMNGRPVITFTHGAPVNTVTGGGHYCSGGLGLAVGLNGSDTSFQYQLYLNGIPQGPAITGTGSSLDFGIRNMEGSYSVAATGVDTTCITPMNDTVEIIIDPLPSPIITSAIPDTMCTFSSPVALTGLPPGGIFTGDGVIHDTLFPTVAGPGTIFIYYDFTDSVTGCSTYASDIVLIDICNFLEDISKYSFSVYPNPANNEIYFQLDLNNNRNFILELINETGMITSKKEFKNTGSNYFFRLNIADISNGIYLLRITQDESAISKKIIVSHD
jgi:PKD repeat protein